MSMRSLVCAVGLILVLTGVPPAHAEKWVSARSTHFAIVSNAGEKTARRVAGDLPPRSEREQRSLDDAGGETDLLEGQVGAVHLTALGSILACVFF